MEAAAVAELEGAARPVARAAAVEIEAAAAEDEDSPCSARGVDGVGMSGPWS